MSDDERGRLSHGPWSDDCSDRGPASGVSYDTPGSERRPASDHGQAEGGILSVSERRSGVVLGSRVLPDREGTIGRGGVGRRPVPAPCRDAREGRARERTVAELTPPPAPLPADARTARRRRRPWRGHPRAPNWPADVCRVSVAWPAGMFPCMAEGCLFCT